MFRATARRDARPAPAEQPAPTGQPGKGRHHRSHLARERSEARDASERIARAQRRASQVGATTPVAGTPALRTPTDGTPAQSPTTQSPITQSPTTQVAAAPAGTPGTSSGRFVIDNALARRDPLTRPLPSAPGLPGARRSPDARRSVAGAGAL